MARKDRAIMILGPNGSGKTAVAAALARTMGGEIVNADKIYVYRRFPIGTGLSDTLAERGVIRHLYEMLEPDEVLFTPSRYAAMVRAACDEISNSNGVPIIEGGSTTYVPAILDLNATKPFCTPIIGLSPPSGDVFLRKVRRRMELALQDGLVDEVKRGLADGFRETLIMRTCFFIVPIIRHLDGAISIEEAREEIVRGCMSYADSQMEIFRTFPEISWVATAGADTATVLKSILPLV